MNIERMQPADFDAVYRLLTQSFPATARRGAARPGSARWRRLCTRACTGRRPRRSNKCISARNCTDTQFRALLRYVSVMHPPAEPSIAKWEKTLLLTAANRSLAANASSCSSRKKSTVSRSCSSKAAPCLHSPVS